MHIRAALAVGLIVMALVPANALAEEFRARGQEDAHISTGPRGGPSVVTPGRDLIDRTMPAGPQTRHSFPDPPDTRNPDNTTVRTDDSRDD